MKEDSIRRLVNVPRDRADFYHIKLAQRGLRTTVSVRASGQTVNLELWPGVDEGQVRAVLAELGYQADPSLDRTAVPDRI